MFIYGYPKTFFRCSRLSSPPFSFSLSAIFGLALGAGAWRGDTNLGRMAIALLMLGAWAHTIGHGLHGASFPWFFLSGLVGYGLGDIALYQAFTRIGPRLTMLLVHCLAVPIAAVAENLWLGATLGLGEIACVCVILTGVWIALTPVRNFNVKAGLFWAGAFFGVCASAGQAGGAVISRKAYKVAALSGMHIDGGTAAYQRMIGGILVAGVFTFLTKRLQLKIDVPGTVQHGNHRAQRGAWKFVVLNAIAGPTLGVACFQWALWIAPSGIVLPIVATTPVVAIPLTYWLDGDRPSLRSVIGGVIAVGGTVALAIAHSMY